MAAEVRRARGRCLTLGLARGGLHGTVLRSLLFITALSGLVRLPAATEAKECDKPCLNGQCNTASGACVCEPGWVGEQCQHCGGRFRWDRRILFPANACDIDTNEALSEHAGTFVIAWFMYGNINKVSWRLVLGNYEYIRPGLSSIWYWRQKLVQVLISLESLKPSKCYIGCIYNIWWGSCEVYIVLYLIEMWPQNQS